MNNQKTIKKKMIIIFYLICFGLICSVTAAYALARPVLNTLEEPEILYNPSILTNQAPQTSSSTILPTEGFEPHDTLLPVERISPAISKDPNCVTPYTYMHITEDTTFCPGDYAYTGSEGHSFIYISASDITLDCNGARLYSPPGYTDVRGINTYDFNPPHDGYDNVTIINCTLDSFYIGMYTSNNENLTVENNIFNGNMDIGFYAKDSTTSNFKFNTFEGVWNDYAYYTYFFNVNNSIIENNQKLQGSDTHGMATIFLNESVGNIIFNNHLFGNAGIRLTRYSDDNDIFSNQLGHIPDTALERVAISIDRASNTNIIGSNLITDNPNGFGIGFFGHDDSDEISYGGTHSNDITDNEIIDVQVGIYANHNTNNCYFFSNTFSNITYNALLMEPYYVNSESMWYYPQYNTFDNNTATNAFRDVVFTNGVHDNVVKNNTFENSQDAAILLYHYASPSNKIQNNSFKNNQILNSQNVGIKFEVNAADNNTFTSNQIINAVDRGLYILSGNTNNTFLDNHFISNGTQAYNNSTSSSFDNGEKGNYWNDFKNPADGCTDTNFNGICDSAYTNISGVAGSVDNYPISGVPLIETINPIVIDETGWAIITVNATDPNGDEMDYIVDNSNFGRFWCWPSTMSFAWRTNEYSGGSYTVNITVDDGEHEVQQPVNITVRNTCNLNKWGQMVCQTHPNSPNCY